MNKSLLMTIVFATALTQASQNPKGVSFHPDTPPYAAWSNKPVSNQHDSLNRSFRFSQNGSSPEQQNPSSSSLTARLSSSALYDAKQTPNTSEISPDAQEPKDFSGATAPSNTPERITPGAIAPCNTPENYSGTAAPCNTPEPTLSPEEMYNLEHAELSKRIRVSGTQEQEREDLKFFGKTGTFKTVDALLIQQAITRPLPVRVYGTPIQSSTGMAITPVYSTDTK
ncbi:MAG: hypothetical protein WC747_04940 [Candidatus Babeliales bacterium]